jgi:hypothetical protein
MKMEETTKMAETETNPEENKNVIPERLEDVADIPLRKTEKSIGIWKPLGIIFLGGLLYLGWNDSNEKSKLLDKYGKKMLNLETENYALSQKNKGLEAEIESLKNYDQTTIYNVAYKTKPELLLMTAAVETGKKVDNEYNLLYCDSRNRIGKELLSIMPEIWLKYNNAYKNRKLDIVISGNTMKLGTWNLDNRFSSKEKRQINDNQKNSLLDYLRK